MSVATRAITTATFASTMVFLFFLAPQPLVAADDMWDGVFTYQKKMADYGNAEAQYKLGEMYEEGHGTVQDFDSAAEWYRKAAAQGYAPASKKLEQLGLRKQRAIAQAKAEKERQLAEQARLEREKAERQKAELERLEREKAAQLQAEREAREKVEQERLARQQAEEKRDLEEEKKRQAEKERLARARAEAAMKAMMAVPSAYTED